MTGFFEANLYQPLSLVTVAALDDIDGYTVDYCGADIWPATATTSKRFPVTKTDNNIDGIMDRFLPEDIEQIIKDFVGKAWEWMQANQVSVMIINAS